MGKIALGAAVLAAALVLLLGLAGKAGAILPAGENPGYVSRLFDGSRVHRVDIQVEDWEAFLASAPEEEYIPATVEIDGEAFRQVGLRAKGNNSLRLTAEYGLSRYSLKLEFDHYTDGSYHGLDKLSLDASFQDNSYLKTWLAFDIMEFLGVPTPLHSFVWVTVNGQPWGLFLAVEEPEEAFARRNFGANHGQLYKPDYRSLAEENADVHLRYTTDEPEDYPGIFENAKLDPSPADRQRLVDSLKTLDSGQRLEEAVDVDEVLRYFVGQVFVMNWDSYLGHTGHNYLLYEEEGKLSMLPWDYNLAFGTYALGMTDPITDPNVLLNYPILTPAPGEYMTKRPLYHQLMQVDAYYLRYQELFGWFLAEYVESGELSAALWQAAELIAPYVEADPTAFCSYEDHRLAVETLEQVCLLRAESARGQLEGRYPATLAQQTQRPGEGVDASHVDLRHLGDFEDLEQAGTGKT
ncbi:MAG TPA: CotH kinase family protein [Candidatus Acutalibacter ornithocaccae]|uniref:CotH kinase family protein n=1 Tax=Candidatus Acutalibacter ornithocaccae TaxID=2838416 RepID=A0A9D2M0G3_9FIRM|nr:CotH kinase family protein [Candidatus Acutalibacter ornithocaccae]